MNRAVFLDRDNTLIYNDDDLGDPSQVRLIQGAATAVASMRGLGYKIVVITNQGGVARGKYGEADVDAVHQRLVELLKEHANGATVDRFYYCPYHPEGTVPRYRREHSWRKPAPGMLQQAAADLNLDLSLCWMVGDQPRDIEAGKAAGVRTVLVHPPGVAPDVEQLASQVHPDFVARNLVEAARVIAQALRPEAVSETGDAASDASSGQAAGGAAGEGAARSTYPAVERLQPTHTPPPRSPRVHRPFKPWDIQPVSSEDAHAGDPAISTARMTQPASQIPAPEIRPPAPPQTPPPAPAPQPESHTDTAAQAAPSAVATEPAPSVRTQAPPAESEPVDESETHDDLGEEDLSARQLLAQIVRELRRGRHADHSDWSAHKAIGLGIAQPLAGFCALMGVLNAGDVMVMLAWLMGAGLMQLLVITLLLLHWQR